MAYNTKDLEAQALSLIKNEKLAFIEHVVAYLPCDKSTFYAHGLHESNVLKEALDFQKIEKKRELQNKWMESDNATTQIALYKLLSNKEEFSKLCGQQVDHTSKGNSVTGFEIVAPDED